MSQPIGVVRQYSDLLAIARGRMAQLGISFETLDHVSGVQSGYSAKLLGPTPTKSLGPVSFACIMGALGLQLLAVEDHDAMARISHRLIRRNESQVRHRPQMTLDAPA